MLVKLIWITLFLLLIFLYASSKLVVKLDKSPYVNVFYVLMFITFLTALQVIFCFYMFLKFRTKDGEEGPRGFQGFPGEKGDPGKCNQNTCRANIIRVMIEKIFEKKLGRELNNNEKSVLYSPDLKQYFTPKSFIKQNYLEDEFYYCTFSIYRFCFLYGTKI
jgi:hypothetical protein